jgi:ABC-type Mn2+/Zn2+ transport system ATPase subunit
MFFLTIATLVIINACIMAISHKTYQECERELKIANYQRLLAHISSLPYAEIRQLSGPSLPVLFNRTTEALVLGIQNMISYSSIVLSTIVFFILMLRRSILTLPPLLAGFWAAIAVIRAGNAKRGDELIMAQLNANIANSTHMIFDASVNRELDELRNSMEVFENDLEKRVAKESWMSAMITRSAYLVLMFSAFFMAFFIIDFTNCANFTSTVYTVLDLHTILDAYTMICRNDTLIANYYPQLCQILQITPRHIYPQYGLEIGTAAWKINMSNLKIIAGNFTLSQDLPRVFRRGDRILIDGASGEGKTTLLRTIAGLVEPHSITLELVPNDDEDVIGVPITDGWGSFRNSICYMYQDPVAPSGMVADVVGTDIELVQMCLHMVELSNRAEYETSQLSGGELSRLNIARNIYRIEQKGLVVLILDEIDRGLDAQRAVRIIGRILERYHNRLVFVVSHEASVKLLFHQEQRICISGGQF